MDKTITLEGVCDKVIYYNSDNGYCVFRVTQDNKTQICTGISPNIKEGQHLKLSGTLEENKYGLQLQCDEIFAILPKDKTGIMNYLSSGAIPGIGEAFAKRLVDFAGVKIFDILDKTPQKLYEIKGIGKKRIETLIKHWSENKDQHEVLLYLQRYNVGPKRALKIYQTYHQETLHVLQTNPYQIYQDINGIGFKIADNIAQSAGIEKDAPIRLSAATQYLLEQGMQSGHCFLPKPTLLTQLSKLLGIDITIDLVQICDEKHFHLTDENIYLKSVYLAERSVEKKLQALNKSPSIWENKSISDTFNRLEGLSFSPSQSQYRACQTVLNHKVGIITGGPGVGKTTLTNIIVQLARLSKLKVSLCAPTGRAAKKLSASTNLEAKTIHRLLKMDPVAKRFQYNNDNHLPADLIIVDEASMIDIFLANSLLQAVDPLANIIFVGDIDQLPAVGPGAFLKDLIQLYPNSTAHLTEIFRQAQHSKIIQNAHRINQGKMLLANAQTQLSDFYLIPQTDPQQIIANIQQLVSNRIPSRFQLNPLEDIQVLSPMHKGLLGTQNLNTVLQKTLNPNTSSALKFQLNDKVIQLKNNYDKDVFNGDIGFITNINVQHSTLHVDFSQHTVEYLFSELEELELAYAISIHKSQGSEYPAIVIPIAMQHFTLLERNLLYTAITRGKQLVVLIGDPKAIAMAIRNQKSKDRFSHLQI